MIKPKNPTPINILKNMSKTSPSLLQKRVRQRVQGLNLLVIKYRFHDNLFVLVLICPYIRTHNERLSTHYMAGATGFEPALQVLETRILPLNYAPSNLIMVNPTGLRPVSNRL